MNSASLVIVAAALEAAGITSLLSSMDETTRIVAYMCAHAPASALLALILFRLLPERYRGQPVTSILFLFLLQFAVPFIGSVGVALGILLALYLPRSQREVPWQSIEIPELPFRPVEMENQLLYSEGGLRQVLREAQDPDKRLTALMASKQMAERDAVALLREALTDKVDDVRLLAYSMLEEKEKKLARRANQLQQGLARAEQSQIVQMERRLAQVWWEMAYLGLAQGGLKTYYLQNTRTIPRRLVERRSHPNDWRLLGRTALALGESAEAKTAFHESLTAGAPVELVCPYLAEVAFIERDFDRVRRELEAGNNERTNPAMKPLLEAWL